MKFKQGDVTIHRSVDPSDPGFALKGFKLRWISAGVESRRAGRIWKPLTLSMLPEPVVKSLQESNSSWTQTETIRKRDQVLSFAPIDLVNERREELRQNQRANEAIFAGKRKLAGGRITSEGSSNTERIEASQEFN